MVSSVAASPFKQRVFCAGCIALPALSFVLGLFTVDFPVAVLAIGIAGACALWVSVLRFLVAPADLQIDGALAAAGCLALVSGIYGYLTGLIVGRQGAIDVGVALVAFGLGLAASILYRRRSRHLARQASTLPLRVPELLEV